MSREPYPEIADKLRQLMLDKIEKREPPKTIWFTDTVYCGRKKIFAMLGGRQRFNNTALNKIWLGIVVGEALKSLGIAGEVPVEYKGMNGRIDVLLETGEPMEVKTASNLYITASEYTETHVQQLSRYCLALGKETGILFYYVPQVSIMSLPAYRYRFDLDKVREETDERLELLKQAAKALDPFMLPITWHSKDMDNWECRQCMYQEVCRRERI